MARTKQTKMTKTASRNSRGARGITKTINKKGKGKGARKNYGDKSPRKNKNPPINTSSNRRRPHRWKPGTVAIREIRKYQKSTDLLLLRRPFVRVVREIAQSCELQNPNDTIRWQKDALEALQQAGEAHLVDLFQRAQIAAVHGKRVTVMCKDLHVVRRLCDGTNYDPIL